MAVKWQQALLKAGEEVMKKGWCLEFIVYKNGNKRKAMIKIIPPKQQIDCDEEEIIE